MMKKSGKFLGLLYFTACFMLLFIHSAHAYIDPSVTTYAIQAMAGIVVAVGAFAAVHWRRAKKKVNKTLGIDTNAKKEVEDEVVEFTQNAKEKISK